jgi:hypothetical protein
MARRVDAEKVEEEEGSVLDSSLPAAAITSSSLNPLHEVNDPVVSVVVDEEDDSDDGDVEFVFDDDDNAPAGPAASSTQPAALNPVAANSEQQLRRAHNPLYLDSTAGQRLNRGGRFDDAFFELDGDDDAGGTAGGAIPAAGRTADDEANNSDDDVEDVFLVDQEAPPSPTLAEWDLTAAGGPSQLPLPQHSQQQSTKAASPPARFAAQHAELSASAATRAAITSQRREGALLAPTVTDTIQGRDSTARREHHPSTSPREVVVVVPARVVADDDDQGYYMGNLAESEGSETSDEDVFGIDGDDDGLAVPAAHLGPSAYYSSANALTPLGEDGGEAMEDRIF